MTSFLDLSINATLLQDGTFGPALAAPATLFDFTILFEKSVLSIVPSSVFLLYGAVRAWWLWGGSRKARWCWGVSGKQLLYLLLLAAHITILALTATNAQSTTTSASPITLASQTMTIPVTLALSTLSLLEHLHSPRTPDLINIYLLLSLILDAAQLRTLWLRPFIPFSLAIAASVAPAIKLALVVAEAQSKLKYLLEDYQNLAPETLSGVYARRLFWWLNGMLRKGWGVSFRLGELMRIREDFGARGLLEGIEATGYLGNRKARRSLVRACLVTFKYEIGLLVIPRGILLALNYTQPLLFEAIISHLDASPESRKKNDGYGLIAATGLLYVCLAVGKTYYQHKTYQLVTKVRGALVSLLYVRTLDSAPGGLSDRAPVSLMSVDVDGVTNAVPVYNELWASAVEIGIAGWLLKRQLGVVWVVPFGIALGCSTLAIFLSRKMGPRQAKWNAVTQERVSGTSLALDSIKSIKMMGFSRYVIEDIRGLRDKEIRSFKVFRRYTVFLNALGNLPFYASPVLTFTAYALTTKGDFTAGKAFTSLSLIALLEESTSAFIGAMPQLAAARGCLGRLEEFLVKVAPRNSSSAYETSDNGSPSEDSEELPSKSREKETSPFSLRNATLKPSAEAHGFYLRNVHVDIQPGKLVGITGPAGCGKTTLIKALLSRLPEMTNEIARRGGQSIAYCAQNPWLPSSTIRDAVIGESEADEQWYTVVLSACGLTEDLKNWENGDWTEVGNQGSNLSGGQRQRVALARALFSRRKIIVLDDVLSGMDAHTTTHICHALLGRRGVFRKLGATVVVVTHSAQVLQVMDTILTLTSEGDINESQLQRISDIGFDTVSLDEVPNEKTSSNTITESDTTEPAAAERVELVEDMYPARQKGDWQLYKHYIKSITWWRFGFLVAAHLANTALDNFPTLWLKQWSSVTQDIDSPDRTAYYLGIYGLVATLGLFFLLFSIWLVFMVIVPASGRNLHTSLLDTVINAKQTFHDKTPTGTTLNRFTQDMQHIDRDVPTAMLRSLTATVECLAAFVLLSISASYTAALIPVLLVVLYYLQKFYLRTSRQLRLLDIEARAPLFTIFQETVDGLDTIVSFKWNAAWKQRFFDTLDASQKPYYLMFCIQRWLILVLGFVVSAMATVLVTLALQIRGLSSAGAIGVGLIALLKFNDRLHLLIVEWTTLETSLGAIARLKAFSQDTPIEDGAHHEGFDDAWPSQGTVEFSDVSATYSDDLPSILNSISFTISPASTCALVGRTGSGKSTTISLLMRLMDPVKGAISVDGISLSAVPLQTLRSRIACLPQQPYLLPGSLRRNLDPNQASSDSDLHSALRRVQLWNVFTSSTDETEPNKVLDTILHASTLSPGQTQLLVLARTLLLTPRPKILVLDEVSSSLDDASEALLQEVVREEFAAKGCTVMAVAHRLKGVVGYDKVVVLDAGRVVEMGVPRELVRGGGAFARLCREQGIVQS